MMVNQGVWISLTDPWIELMTTTLNADIQKVTLSGGEFLESFGSNGRWFDIYRQILALVTDF